MIVPVSFEAEYPEESGILIEIQKRRRLFGRLVPKIHVPVVLSERNTPCACGSGIKTKRCCLLVPRVKDWSAWTMHIISIAGVACSIRLNSQTKTNN